MMEKNTQSVRRRHEQAQAAQTKKRARIYWAIGIVVAVLVAALLIWDNGVIQRNAAAYQVGDYSFSVNDVNYYYYNTYNQIAPYASFYGLDTSQPLDEQEYEEGTTWKDYLMEQAKGTMQEVAVLNTQAKAEGFTLSDEGKQSVADAVQSMKDAAVQYGISEATYLNYAYGRFMTPAAYEKCVQRQQLASEYAKHLQEGYDISEEDMTAYYEENAATMDTFDYDAYYVSLGLTAEYDDEGKQKDYDAEALKSAQEEASAKAEEMQQVLSGDDADAVAAKATELGLSSLSGLASSTLSYYEFGAWVTDPERKSGDVSIVEETSTDSQEQEYVSGYYVVRFNSRTLEEYYGVNFYNLLVQAEAIESDSEGEEDTAAATEYNWDAAKEKAESLQQQWLDEGGSAEGFLTMAQENSDGSVTEYTNVDRDAQNAEVNAWLFDTEHQAGDYAIIQDETLHGYRLVYFTGYDELYYWQTKAKDAITSERYDTWLTEAKENASVRETGMFAQAA